MDPLSILVIGACGVLVAYVAWRLVDFARHDIVVEEGNLRWHIDAQALHARVRALPGHHAAGGERNYELRRDPSGSWDMRLSHSARSMMVDETRRALQAASDKQRLEVREEVETVLEENDWRPVPKPVAHALESEYRRPGTTLARHGSRIV